MAAIFVMESIMDHVANSLQLDVEQVKRANLCRQGDILYNVSNELDRRWNLVVLLLFLQINYPREFKLDHCNIESMWDGE